MIIIIVVESMENVTAQQAGPHPDWASSWSFWELVKGFRYTYFLLPWQWQYWHLLKSHYSLSNCHNKMKFTIIFGSKIFPPNTLGCTVVESWCTYTSDWGEIFHLPYLMISSSASWKQYCYQQGRIVTWDLPGNKIIKILFRGHLAMFPGRSVLG